MIEAFGTNQILFFLLIMSVTALFAGFFAGFFGIGGGIITVPCLFYIFGAVGIDKSFIKSQRKLSLIIQNGLVIFIDTFGDINALDIETGNLIWQSQTIVEDIYESAFLLKNSRIVSDAENIYVSNNKNKNNFMHLSFHKYYYKEKL